MSNRGENGKSQPVSQMVPKIQLFVMEANIWLSSLIFIPVSAIPSTWFLRRGRFIETHSIERGRGSLSHLVLQGLEELGPSLALVLSKKSFPIPLLSPPLDHFSTRHAVLNHNNSGRFLPWWGPVHE